MKPIRQVLSLGSVKQILIKPKLLLQLPWYLRQLKQYRRSELELSEKLVSIRYYPCLTDRQSAQPANGYYFYQDCWAARQVFNEKPAWGVDVGSTVLLVGIISQFARWHSVDIRPLQSELEGLECKPGSVLDLPFKNDEVPCLTTMCVLEHIGLGRYGDPLNPNGTHDAVREIRRVVAPGGIVVFSVPVWRNELLEFNANRRFTLAQARGFFEGWQLVASCLLTPSPKPLVSEASIFQVQDPVACFCFRKPA